LGTAQFSTKKFTDFAILYRTNSQTRAFEDALRRKNIPYRVYGGLSFIKEKKSKIWWLISEFWSMKMTMKL
jgi:superfamily I DNA/RNA helicase